MDKVREEFEAWAVEEMGWDLSPNSLEGSYYESDVKIAWKTWQAAQLTPPAGDEFRPVKDDKLIEVLKQAQVMAENPPYLVSDHTDLIQRAKEALRLADHLIWDYIQRGHKPKIAEDVDYVRNTLKDLVNVLKGEK